MNFEVGLTTVFKFEKKKCSFQKIDLSGHQSSIFKRVFVWTFFFPPSFLSIYKRHLDKKPPRPGIRINGPQSWREGFRSLTIIELFSIFKICESFCMIMIGVNF